MVERSTRKNRRAKGPSRALARVFAWAANLLMPPRIKEVPARTLKCDPTLDN